MIDGTFALQISRETVPDFATANIEFDNIFDFIFSSDIASTLLKFVLLILFLLNLYFDQLHEKRNYTDRIFHSLI